MDYNIALNMMRAGHTLTRTEWADNEQKVTIRDKGIWRRELISEYSETRIAMPWKPGILDELAMDWELVR